VAAAVAEQVPKMKVVVAEGLDDALAEIADADAAFGAIPPELLQAAPQPEVAAGPVHRAAGWPITRRS